MGSDVLSVLAGRIQVAHANHKRIAAGAALIGVLTVFAKLFVAGREVAIAWRFGISGTVDAYQLALTITTWLPMMMTSVLTVVLVPRFVTLQGRPDDRQAFIAELNGTMLVLGLLVAILSWACAPALSALLASDTQAATARMARAMAPVAMYTLWVGYWSARLQSGERFTYSVTEAVPALTIALFTVAPVELAGEARLIWGTSVGFLLQAVLLSAMTWRGDPGLGTLRLRHRSPEWTSLYGAVALMVLGQGLIGSAIPVDQAFAARLGQGAVATLGYVNRIVTLITTIGTVVVARALLPVLSAAVAGGELRLGRRQALQWSAMLFAVSLIGIFVIAVTAPELVRLLFERGAFDTSASATVANALRFGLLQAPPYFGGIVLVQWYAATGRFRAILVISALALMLKLVLNLVLAPVWGIAGIMVSTCAMYVLTGALLVFGLRGAPSGPCARIGSETSAG